jgi:hypothetical protein
VSTAVDARRAATSSEPTAPRGPHPERRPAPGAALTWEIVSRRTPAPTKAPVPATGAEAQARDAQTARTQSGLPSTSPVPARGSVPETPPPDVAASPARRGVQTESLASPGAADVQSDPAALPRVAVPRSPDVQVDVRQGPDTASGGAVD